MQGSCPSILARHSYLAESSIVLGKQSPLCANNGQERMVGDHAHCARIMWCGLFMCTVGVVTSLSGRRGVLTNEQGDMALAQEDWPQDNPATELPHFPAKHWKRCLKREVEKAGKSVSRIRRAKAGGPDTAHFLC